MQIHPIVPRFDPSDLRLQRDSQSSAPQPLALLTLERPPQNYSPPFSSFRVGMVVIEHLVSKETWVLDQPWRAPERTPRMAALVTQLLQHCHLQGWTFDLLVFPAGTLNYYGTASVSRVLEQSEIHRIAAGLRRAGRTVRSLVFGVTVREGQVRDEALSGDCSETTWLEARHPLQQPGGPELAGRPAAQDQAPAQDRSWSYALAIEAGDTPLVYQQHRPSPDLPGDQQCGDATNRLVTLGDRRIRLSLHQEQFEGATPAERVRRQLDDIDLWVNPIDVNHPGGGASPGSWPGARVEQALRNETVPIFLPHHRRSRLEGPFWFAGHPRQPRTHRWQPDDQTSFISREGRLQLLTYDLRF